MLDTTGQPIQIGIRMTLHQMFRLLPLFAIFAATTAFVPPAEAQGPTYHPPIDPHNVTASSLNHPLDLTASWLVRQGDDAAYASPAFDDSQWTVIDITKPLASYGIVHPNFVWYRTHVQIASGQHNLAILFRQFAGSEEVFVNGVLTGPVTDFPAGGGRVGRNPDRRATLPDDLIASGKLTIAVRAQIQAAAASLNSAPGFGPYTTFSLGDASVLSERTALFNFRAFTSNAVNTALTGLILFIAIALALTLRDEREYLALCLFLATLFLTDAIGIWQDSHLLSYSRWSLLPVQVLSLIGIIAGIEFARMILRLPRSRWIVAYEWLIGFCMIAGMVFNIVTYTAQIPPRAVLFTLVALTAAVIAPLYLGLPLFALWIWRRQRNLDALLLSIPLLIQGMFLYLQISLAVLYFAHLSKHAFIPPASSDILYFRWDELAHFLFLLALLGFLILRTVRLARARAELAAELAAAQHVQQLLLSGSSSPTPGFQVETAFHPANQVGGDFFLLSPLEDGSLFVIVGDVSGKGLTAAMRVAMILGVLRRETSRDPAVALANLNDALLSQSEMGFTTACCVHLFPDGRFIAANAGHISPYIGGAELETPPALPLGLASDQVYDLVVGQLAANESMVLMSDGVPEARNNEGELYGFERLPNLTLLRAQQIADTAVRFGQEDDITVLTLAVA
ncbi:PP2C family protein-serine/threonine phosphatase [Granulicella sp. L46]|uniref:PP2C family protein-serine/threonine phosphatase n=1 Tax=Granulicella sp. L46 TaxID=1641865 RepID=UPI0020B15D70|nr:PP2C family protein-serine/threonine phosphatase [Granulicella sp. L46]